MISPLQWLLVILLVLIVPGYRAHDCDSLLGAFEEKYRAVPVTTHDARPDGLDPFIFFLHVPRTAGKTYSTCFLSPSVPPSETCLPGYDRYRLHQSSLGCRYYSSHDDLSLVDQLSEDDKKRVEVVTQLRDPVARVLSAYEFPIEVAARKVMEPISVIDNSKANSTSVNTYNVWPWNYLVLHARGEMQSRLEKIKEKEFTPSWTEHVDPKTNRTFYWNKEKNTSEWSRPSPKNVLDPYDNELAMSLREWIETQEAEELVHNGHTLQLLGITNASHWEEAGALRNCFFRHEPSRERLFELAKEKLRAMPHAGLQERLEDSVASLAASLQLKMSDNAYKAVQLSSNVFDDAENPPDLDAAVRYKSTISRKEHVMSLKEARFALYKLEENLKRVNAKLKKQEPRLQALLEREEDWLEMKEKERENSTYWKMKRAFVDPIMTRVKWVAFTAKSAVSGRLGDLEDFDWYNDAESELLLKMSPFAANITTLDEEVAAMQSQQRGLIADIETLKGVDGVKGVPWGNGTRVFLPFRDEEMLRKDRTLGVAYATCSRDSYEKGKRSHQKPMQHLRNEFDQGFQFNSDYRARFLKDEKNRALLARIRELNAIDQRLIEFATEIFEETLRRQREAGELEKIPAPLPKAGQQKSNPPPPASTTGGHSEL